VKQQADVAKKEADVAKLQAKKEADVAKAQAEVAKKEAEVAKKEAEVAKKEAEVAKQQTIEMEARRAPAGALGGPSPQQLALRKALADRDFLVAGNVVVEVLGQYAKEPTARGTYNGDELKLFAQFELGPKTIDRDGALAVLQENMKLGFIGHGSYCAMWASPGSGKTHLLAAATELMISGEWKGPKGSPLLPLLVSFNNKSPEIVFGVRGVAVRLLVTYFCGVVAWPVWDTVAQALDVLLPDNFSINHAMWIVNAHVERAAGDRARPTLVVLLDELSKCLGVEPSRLAEIPDAVADIRGQFYPQLTTCKLVLTTRDFVIGKYAPLSGPTRVWIDLPALQYDSVLSLALIETAIALSDAAKPLIALVGGHPRSLGGVDPTSAGANVDAVTPRSCYTVAQCRHSCIVQ
jgi:hypothetical protein